MQKKNHVIIQERIHARCEPAAEPQTPPVASLTCQQRLSEACVAAAKEIAVDNELGDDGVRDNADTMLQAHPSVSSA